MLEVEIEDVGRLSNPIQIGGDVDPENHPSYAVREVARSGAELTGPDDWHASTARHLYTAFGNDDSAAEELGLARLAVPRFLNGPASSLAPSGAVVEIPPRATDIVVTIELAAVVRGLTADATIGHGALLGYAPMIALCDQSFAEAVIEPARAGERGIPAVYGRWADDFTVIGTPSLPGDHDWRGRAMTLRIDDRSVTGSTGSYIAGPGTLVETISPMITLFPGDVITLGATAARIRLTREEYAAGVTVTGSIEGVGEIRAELVAHP